MIPLATTPVPVTLYILCAWIAFVTILFFHKWVP
jgi:hypothetical protein